MRITGELVNYNICKKGDAEIELPPVDSTKLKVGDTVWIETYLFKDGRGNIIPSRSAQAEYVAHFPSTEKPGEVKEEIKLPEKLDWTKKTINVIGEEDRNNLHNFVMELQITLNALIDVVREMEERKSV